MPHRFCTLPYMNQLRKDPARVFLLPYPHRFPRLPPAPGPGTPPRTGRMPASLASKSREQVAAYVRNRTERIRAVN